MWKIESDKNELKKKEEKEKEKIKRPIVSNREQGNS